MDSLFTNAPLDNLLDFLARKRSSSHEKISIRVNCFIDVISLCVTNNVCTFDSEVYKQFNGIAFGSSLSLANLCMFESELLPSFLLLDTTCFRYIDIFFYVFSVRISMIFFQKT